MAEKKVAKVERKARTKPITPAQFYEEAAKLTLGQLQEKIANSIVKCSWPTCNQKLPKESKIGIVLLKETTKYCPICKDEIAKVTVPIKKAGRPKKAK